MTIVKGQIESFKRIISELDKKGINRFNSIADINHFLKNYQSEKRSVLGQIKKDVETEIEVLKNEEKTYQEHYDGRKEEETKKLTNKIEKLQSQYNRIKSQNAIFIIRAYHFFHLRILGSRLTHLKKHFDDILFKKTAAAGDQLLSTRQRLNEHTIHREKIIADRSKSQLAKLALTKDVLDGLYSLIAGAIGENMVANELQKLQDSYVLFNDYSIQFERPIYYKKENTRIQSIQIDHLLITNAGVFIVETKNWSKQSIENFDLRSPVEQILRTNHALFTLLNSDSKKSKIRLNQHHWGAKKIPIKSVIVMINHKPREKFQYVAVKTLNELNRYINYFEPIFDDNEVRRIADYLDQIRDRQKDVSSLNVNPRSHLKTTNKPSIQVWLKNNPGMSINDYYRSTGN